ncbi:hypothetical protein [Chlorobium phaeobacteroides]|uniref:hypothetical protein n=1 Tax=Chlorobium phaeobacteroides TaxID=1096 RepID=UPI000305C607|nr:hypothetical protein [Chlorobium phaeobacteroides]
MTLFPWAKCRTDKGAAITDRKVHDVNILDLLVVEPGSFYFMDRAYVDFDRLYAIHQPGGMLF